MTPATSLLVGIAAGLCLSISSPTPAASGPQVFDSPQLAADALMKAVEAFDTLMLEEIFGPAGRDLFISGEEPQDRQRLEDFAREARIGRNITFDPADDSRVLLIVGTDNWPFPIPIVRKGNAWFFDAEAGREELLHRRVGANELDAIRICRGYVEAQREYALQRREESRIAQYAERVVSTPGTHDGLAWQTADGAWAGPVGEKIAHAIEQGYAAGAQPYRGYYFKILKGQGPAARLGEMDFKVAGLMIGGFALVAAPARYGVTGVKTFIVSHDAIVYEKDFGADTLEAFRTMERFNPDPSWTAIAARP